MIKMEFIKQFKEKQQSRRLQEIRSQADRFITVTDFNSGLYIAYDGTPLFPIEKEWTTKEIVEKLKVLRDNYISSKIKNMVSPA